MRSADLLRLAIARLAVGRMRAALTMLGVIIGVASVIALVAVGQGASSGITTRLQGLGTNLLTITPGAHVDAAARAARRARPRRSPSPTRRRWRPSRAWRRWRPRSRPQSVVIAGTLNTTTSIVGTTPDYLTVRAYDLWVGSFLTQPANDNRLRVACWGRRRPTIWVSVPSSLGSDVTIGGLPFQVIGILQAKGSTGLGNADDQVIIPIATAQQLLHRRLPASATSRCRRGRLQMDTASAELATLLRGRHNLTAEDSDDFTISNQAQLLSTVSSVGDTLTLLLAGIASISLAGGRDRDHEHHAGVGDASGRARSASARRSARGAATSSPSSWSRRSRCRCWAG